MTIIGVCNRKGGVGKTTTAVHVASELASRGFSVELVDCDDQVSAASWASKGKLPMHVRTLPALEQGDDLQEWADTVRAISADLVILDSPARFGFSLGAVIALSDLILVPCGASGLDLRATEDTVRLVREIRYERGERKPGILLVPNRADWRTSAGRELREALESLGEPVASELRARAAFAEAFDQGLWAGTLAPESAAHLEVRALVDRVLLEIEATATLAQSNVRIPLERVVPPMGSSRQAAA